MTGTLLSIIFLLQPAPKIDADRSPEAVVRAMFAAFNRHDAVAMERIYAPDARLTSSDFCRARGRSDVRRTYEALFRAFPDIRDDVTTVVSEGDHVAVRFMAVSRRGGMSLKIHTFLRVRDGQILEDDSVFDTGGQACEP